jgi:hypothetical protein
MKCPECGFEGILEDEKFCGECGAAIRTEVSKWDLPKWKWGSLIASTVLVFIFWLFIVGSYRSITEFLLGLAIFGFPVIIYLMYKERTEKIKYGLVWVVFPLLVWLFGSYSVDEMFPYFIFFVIPAIIIDMWYVRKLDLKE